MGFQIRCAFMWTCMLLWPLGSCHTCPRDACDDISEEAAKPHEAQSMLQKKTWQQKQSMTITGEASCPTSCQSPECVPGASWNGGMALEGGKCLARCSKKYSGTRYCGWGSAYAAADSIDCSACLSGQFVHAFEGSYTCPSGYSPVTDMNACKAGLIIGGVEHTFAKSGCVNSQWPSPGCFAYGKRLYYSTCTDGSRPLSKSGHEGICEQDQVHVFAPVGSMTCPNGRAPIETLGECMGGVSISGVQYTWNGQAQANGDSICHGLWPAGPTCFAWGTKLYFSSCGSGRPISTEGHRGICKALVIPTSASDALGCSWQPENYLPSSDNSCRTTMPDGSTKSGRCTPHGAAYGPALCSTASSCETVDAACTSEGFTGVCVQALGYSAEEPAVCDIWTTKKPVTTIITTTTKSPTDANCPASCQSPECVQGASWNGGMPLESGKCLAFCSKKYKNTRYCGSGSPYVEGESINCSPCAGQYVFATVGSTTCPSGRAPLVSLQTCMAGATVSGIQYTWNGQTNSNCHGLWPAGPTCFAYGTKLYFSECGSTGRPISTEGHFGICTTIVIPTSASSALGCTWQPENSYPSTDNSCETIMPDGSLKSGRCTPQGAAYGPALCSTASSCETVGAACTSEGFTGKCVQALGYSAEEPAVCDIWSKV